MYNSYSFSFIKLGSSYSNIVNYSFVSKIKTIKKIKHEMLLLSPQVLHNCYTSKYIGKNI